MVTKLDRLARSATKVILLIDELLSHGIKVHVFNMCLMDKTPTGKLIRTIFLVSNEKTLDLSTIYGIVEKSYKEKFKNNSNWQAKVRQTLQDENIFKREERGLFSLA